VGPEQAERLERVRGREPVGGQDPAGRPADEHGLDRAPGPDATRELHDLGQRRPERDLGDPTALVARDLDEDRPGGLGGAGGAEGGGAIAQDPRRGGEGLHVLDDSRHAAIAVGARMRRSLLRLASLPIEGLQEDGLLPEHVRALDRANLDDEAAAGAHRVVTELAP